MVCPRCGHEYPASIPKCRICGADRPPLPPGSLPAIQGEQSCAPLPVPEIHAARTLLVAEEAVEEFRLQPVKSRSLPTGPAAVQQLRTAEDDGFEPGLNPAPVPPGEPGPWQIPTDHPRPVVPMRRVVQGSPDRLSISLPEPQRGCSGQALAAELQDELAMTSGPGGRALERPSREVIGAQLLLEDHGGQVVQQLDLSQGLTRLGRTSGDILFKGDPYIAPTHAWVIVSRKGVRIRDAGSANGIYVHKTEETQLEDGDALLVGSQLLLFRNRWADRELGREGTRLFGSSGFNNPYRLVNLRQGGDLVHVHILDSDLVIGREGASPYRHDRFLSRQHLSVLLTTEGVKVRDISGGRGYYLRLRHEQWLVDGQTFVMGSRLLRLCLRYRS